MLYWSYKQYAEETMNYLFEAVSLKDKPLLFESNIRTTDAFTGYYHWHQCCEILLVHEGKGNIIVNQKTYDMRPGRLFFFQPYQLHRVTADVSQCTPYTRTLLFFDPYIFDKVLHSFPQHHTKLLTLWRNQSAQTVIDLMPQMDYLSHIFAKYSKRTSVHTPLEREEDTSMLMLHILEAILFARDEHAAIDTYSEQYRPFSYSEQVMNWIDQHYAEEIHLNDIAQSLHLSKYYLSRLFQRETGGSLSEYIIARRIKQACRLLYMTTLSVEHIAVNVGYPNTSYFIRIFKKVMGTTPLQYRSAARQTAAKEKSDNS
jgi:AraC-like DNA-binding protein